MHDLRSLALRFRLNMNLMYMCLKGYLSISVSGGGLG